MVGGMVERRDVRIKLKSHHAKLSFCCVRLLPIVLSHLKKHIIARNMSAQVPQFLVGSLLLLMVAAALAVADAKPSQHYPETNQLGGEPEAANNLLDSVLKPWQLEVLAQRLYEINNQQQQQQGLGSSGSDFGWDRTLRSPENKRQSRYRQCYFNPISCFRK